MICAGRFGSLPTKSGVRYCCEQLLPSACAAGIVALRLSACHRRCAVVGPSVAPVLHGQRHALLQRMRIPLSRPKSARCAIPCEPSHTERARSHARTHTNMHTHTRTRTNTRGHTRTHARTQTRTHARAHARTHKDTRAHPQRHTDAHRRTNTHTDADARTRTHNRTRECAWSVAWRLQASTAQYGMCGRRLLNFQPSESRCRRGSSREAIRTIISVLCPLPWGGPTIVFFSELVAFWSVPNASESPGSLVLARASGSLTRRLWRLGGSLRLGGSAVPGPLCPELLSGCQSARRQRHGTAGGRCQCASMRVRHWQPPSRAPAALGAGLRVPVPASGGPARVGPRQL